MITPISIVFLYCFICSLSLTWKKRIWWGPPLDSSCNYPGSTSQQHRVSFCQMCSVSVSIIVWGWNIYCTYVWYYCSLSPKKQLFCFEILVMALWTHFDVETEYRKVFFLLFFSIVATDLNLKVEPILSSTTKIMKWFNICIYSYIYMHINCWLLKFQYC